MNSGPFGNDDDRGSVPSARPAPGKKDDRNIPDWAKITADIANIPDEDTNTIPTIPAPEPAPASKTSPYGDSLPDISELDDDAFYGEEAASTTEPARAAYAEQPVEPSYQESNYSDEPAVYEEEPVAEQPKPKPKRYTPMKKAITKLPANKYQKPPEDSTSAKGRGFKGGRWKVLALRIGVWSSFGIILIVGLFAMFGPKGPTVASVTNNVLAEINRNAFPLEQGEQVASRFLSAYLTYEPGDSTARIAELGQYVIGGTNGRATFIAESKLSRSQIVVDGPFLAKPAELISDNHVVYTFAVKIENPPFVAVDPDNPTVVNILDALPARWMYFSVPMVSDAEGHIAVASSPAVVPAPPLAEGVESIAISVDRDASLDAQAPMQEFFKHWADSFNEGLRPYLVTNESTENTRLGLNKTVAFVSLINLEVEKLPEDYVQDPEVPPTCVGPEYQTPCRTALAQVGWAMPDGSEFVQDYRLTVFNDGQNWRVIDIRGGKFDSIGR